MTTQQSNPNGTISKDEAAWLQRLSDDGYGLIISCAASISNTSTAFYNQLSVADDSKIAALAKLSAAMKMQGSVNIIQLCHGGSRTIESLTGIKQHSASSYSMPMIADFVPPETLTIKQIEDIVSDFANACERVAKAGFDGIELHGANGYLYHKEMKKKERRDCHSNVTQKSHHNNSIRNLELNKSHNIKIVGSHNVKICFSKRNINITLKSLKEMEVDAILMAGEYSIMRTNSVSWQIDRELI